MLNPFNEYITAETMPPDLLSRWFSAEILEVSSVRPVTDRANQFVVGTPGSGKTMLMRMLTFAVQRELRAGNHDEPLPLPDEYLAENKQYLGIYFSFDDFRRQSYDDGRLEPLHAVKALEDYIATRLVLDLLMVLEDVRVARLGGLSRDLEAVAHIATSQLETQGIEINASGWREVLDWFRSRLRSHRRFVLQNDDSFRVPTGLQIIGTPHAIAEAAREAGVLPKQCALYVIIDQADNVLGHETGATVLKNAILSAARQQLPLVFLKVGLRRRSLVELNLSAPKERSIDREMHYIDIDSLTRQGDKEYKNWLSDICRRRLSTSPDLEEQLRHEIRGTNASEHDDVLPLASISGDAEAWDIVGSRQNQTRHIQAFCRDWERLFGIPKRVADAIGEDVSQVDGPLNQMFVLIQLSKLLRKMIVNSFRDDPRNAEEYREAFNLERLNHKERSHTKWTQPAIFQLMGIYGHYRKNYAGFDCLAECSERNVSHFIKTVGKIIDQAPRDEAEKIVLPISVSTQTSVVHYMSDYAWREMLDVSTQGARISALLDSIKMTYRSFLMLPWLPVLCFSSFDLRTDPEHLIAVALETSTTADASSGERTLGLVLREALATGYLRREVKEGGTKYRMRINRIFMPRLDLPTQSQHGPPTIKVEKLLNFFRTAGSHDDIEFNEIDLLIGARQQPYKQMTLPFWEALATNPPTTS